MSIMDGTINLGTTYGGYTGSGYSSSGTSYSTTRKFTSANSTTIGNQFAGTNGAGFKKLVDAIAVNMSADEFMNEWDSLKSELQLAAEEYGYDDLSDTQLTTMMYRGLQKTTGYSDVDEMIDENVHGSFMSGFLQGLDICGLFTDTHSAEELKAEINGRSLKKGEELKEDIGQALGGAALGGVTGFGLCLLLGTGPIGWVIGGLSTLGMVGSLFLRD